jgi:anti-anti-sigma regulatory factor
MLRIEPLDTGGSAVLKVEGRVIGPWVEELREACESALAHGAGLTVDLAGVWFVDREGLALLQWRRERDVGLRHCSTFVDEQLKGWAPWSR